MGTPDFAVPALDALVNICRAQGGEVVGVICQPDRPAGRGNVLTAPPVKIRVQELQLDLLQPTKMRDGSVAQWVHAKQVDLAIVVAFGRILPPDVLAAPRLGCINVHASLLPKYRGAAPIAWAIANGETETGISLMQMDEGLDTGPVYTMHSMAILPDETTGELSLRLAKLAGEILHHDLPLIVAQQLHAQPQDSTQATLARILKKEDGLIDWSQSAIQIHNHVRAMQPWPSAFSYVPNHKILKIVKTQIVQNQILSPIQRKPGVILSADRVGMRVACGVDGLEEIAILLAQPEGKKTMSAGDLVNGRFVSAGIILHSSLNRPT